MLFERILVNSPFWWLWFCITAVILLFLFLQLKVTPESGKRGASTLVTLFIVSISSLVSYYLGYLSGATGNKPLEPEKDTIYKIVSQSFIAGTNNYIVLEQTKLNVATMDWQTIGNPTIYIVTGTITNEIGSRVIGVQDNGTKLINLQSHPLQIQPY